MKVNQSMYSMKQNKEQVFCYYSEKISYHIGIKIKKRKWERWQKYVLQMSQELWFNIDSTSIDKWELYRTWSEYIYLIECIFPNSHAMESESTFPTLLYLFFYGFLKCILPSEQSTSTLQVYFKHHSCLVKLLLKKYLIYEPHVSRGSPMWCTITLLIA